MCKKILTAILFAAAVALTGCTAQGAEETQELSQQEKEVAAVAEWFSESMTDEEDFPDIKDYIGHI